MRSFGAILKSKRQDLGLTQKEVANSVGVSDAYICSLEREKKEPPPYQTVLAIASALKLDGDQLWKVAVKYREKYALEKSRSKTKAQRRNNEKARDSVDSVKDEIIEIPESQINAFFERTEVQMTTFGLFQKQPKDMTMEEKRVVYHALNSARKVLTGS